MADTVNSPTCISWRVLPFSLFSHLFAFSLSQLRGRIGIFLQIKGLITCVMQKLINFLVNFRLPNAFCPRRRQNLGSGSPKVMRVNLPSKTFWLKNGTRWTKGNYSNKCSIYLLIWVKTYIVLAVNECLMFCPSRLVVFQGHQYLLVPASVEKSWVLHIFKSLLSLLNSRRKPLTTNMKISMLNKLYVVIFLYIAVENYYIIIRYLLGDIWRVHVSTCKLCNLLD